MTRPTLAKSADGIYRPLDVQIEDRMKPPVPVRDRWFWLRIAFYAGTTVLAKAGAIIAAVLLGPLGLAVIWVRNRWRVWK